MTKKIIAKIEWTEIQFDIPTIRKDEIYEVISELIGNSDIQIRSPKKANGMYLVFKVVVKKNDIEKILAKLKELVKTNISLNLFKPVFKVNNQTQVMIELMLLKLSDTLIYNSWDNGGLNTIGVILPYSKMLDFVEETEQYFKNRNIEIEWTK